MSYTYDFADDVAYGAEDINNIRARLVSAGVGDNFQDGVAYNVRKLCEISQGLVEPGYVPETDSSLRVTVQDGQAVIAPGMCFLPDGSTLTVTDSEKLDLTAGTKQYVYIKGAMTAENRNYPVVSATAPSSADVPLSEIGADGTVTDKRVYAKGKVPGYRDDTGLAKVVHVEHHLAKQNQPGYKVTEVLCSLRDNPKFVAFYEEKRFDCIGIYSVEEDTIVFGANRARYGDFNKVQDGKGIWTDYADTTIQFRQDEQSQALYYELSNGDRDGTSTVSVCFYIGY